MKNKKSAKLKAHFFTFLILFIPRIFPKPPPHAVFLITMYLLLWFKLCLLQAGNITLSFVCFTKYCNLTKHNYFFQATSAWAYSHYVWCMHCASIKRIVCPNFKIEYALTQQWRRLKHVALVTSWVWILGMQPGRWESFKSTWMPGCLHYVGWIMMLFACCHLSNVLFALMCKLPGSWCPTNGRARTRV